MTNSYVKPLFQLVKPNEANKVFFVASGTPGAPTFSGGKLTSVTKTTGTW